MMNRNLRILVFLVLPAFVVLMMVAAWNAPGSVGALQAGPTPAATPTPLPPPGMFEFDRGILLELKENATQAEFGWEIYRLICSACHAYDGTGLTEKWRSGWNPADQNCWQSKCHALNHPPDGFYLPISPPVVGSIIPGMFNNAQELFEYNYTRMPWHDPGMMNEEEAWAVTLHLLIKNGYEVPDRLGPDNAAAIDLRAGDAANRTNSIYMTAVAAPLMGPVLSAGDMTAAPVIAPTATAAPAEAPAPAPAAQPEAPARRTWVWALPILAAVLLLVMGAARRKKNKNN